MSITDKFFGTPIVKAQRIGHGTLECDDLQITRRFYEEVLGLECHQVSKISMVARLGTIHTYSIVAGLSKNRPDMSLLNHNGLDVESTAEVDRIFAELKTRQEELGIRKIMPIKRTHGDYSFYFMDPDRNWWEILATEGDGYANGFNDSSLDLTGLHELENEKGLVHTHVAETREKVRALRAARGEPGAAGQQA